jgi:hypothetical protein
VFEGNGGRTRTRTWDPLIKSPGECSNIKHHSDKTHDPGGIEW